MLDSDTGHDSASTISRSDLSTLRDDLSYNKGRAFTARCVSSLNKNKLFLPEIKTRTLLAQTVPLTLALVRMVVGAFGIEVALSPHQLAPTLPKIQHLGHASNIGVVLGRRVGLE